MYSYIQSEYWILKIISFLLLFVIFVSASFAQNSITIISQSDDSFSVRYPEYRRLNDGNYIPIVGYGTFTAYKSIRRSGAIEESIITAIEAGYRHIETAPMYHVDEDIRNAILNVTNRGIVTREDLFITAKLDLNVNTTDGVIQSLSTWLDRVQLNYVDLFLIHLSKSMENNEEYEISALWSGMEETQRMGLAVSIGVSNFNSSHINKVLTYGYVRPAVNEIEVNPTFAELEMTAYCLRQGIEVMSYGPYGFMVPRPFRKIPPPPPSFEDPTLVRIAEKYGKSTKQVALRYLIDRGTLPIPHSTNKAHIIENIQLFDFRLTREEIYQINEFNKNIQVYPKDDLKDVNDIFLYFFGCNITDIYKNIYCDT